MNNFEIKLVKYFQEIGGKKIDSLTSFVSDVKMLAILWATLFIGIIYFFPLDRRVFFWRVMVVAILHLAISEGFFKYFLPIFFGERKRPFVAYPEIIKPIGSQFSDGSMPSSHVASTVAMAIVVSLAFPILIFPGIILILLMAFARIHNGMHYFSDVVVGIILGLLYGTVAMILV